MAMPPQHPPHDHCLHALLTLCQHPHLLQLLLLLLLMLAIMHNSVL